ncbi:FtsB family cell division protein [Novosphingobium terrae]|jgi:cell division protein FtsB|nr:septum formation initiator [Novosphingobium terrae]
MKNVRNMHRMAKETMIQWLALGCLLCMLAWSVAGPSGLLAWSENHHALAERQQRIKLLTLQRNELQNRVTLLDPRHTDPDLAGELLRRNLNVAHPDDVIMMVH